jgi:hypothetical protein
MISAAENVAFDADGCVYFWMLAAKGASFSAL